MLSQQGSLNQIWRKFKIAYSDFKLNELVKQFDLTLNENLDLFPDIPEVEPSENLKFSLNTVYIDTVEYYYSVS